MSNASVKTFENEQRYRERRMRNLAENPGFYGVLPDPSWDALWGSLEGHQVDMGSLGRSPRQSLAQMGRPGDQDLARNWSVNQAASDMQDERRTREQELRILKANAEMAEAAAKQAPAPMEDRAAIDRAASLAQIGRGVMPAPIVQSDDGSYASRGSGPTMDPRQVFRDSLPGHLQPGVDAAAQAAEDAKVKNAIALAKQAEETRKNKAEEAISANSIMSPDAIEQNAKLYLQTGTMPPLGMRDPNNRQRILNRAAELSAGGGGNVAANKADYKADSTSLTALQKQRDAINAFEKTAGANIDLFLNAAGKVVDTGSPMANMLARQVSGKMLGSPDQAAFDAARQVAVNEIAKITSNPNLSGQLSDSARHEVDAFNPREATLAQSVAVMRLLKQDMGNRVKFLDESLNDVKTRIAKPGGGAAPKDPLGIR